MQKLLSKGDLMELVLTKEEKNYCDSAIPMHLWEGIDCSLYVYDCRDNKLVNLAERLVTSGKLEKMINDLSDAEYIMKSMRRKYKITDSNFDLIIDSFSE